MRKKARFLTALILIILLSINLSGCTQSTVLPDEFCTAYDALRQKDSLYITAKSILSAGSEAQETEIIYYASGDRSVYKSTPPGMTIVTAYGKQYYSYDSTGVWESMNSQTNTSPPWTSVELDAVENNYASTDTSDGITYVIFSDDNGKVEYQIQNGQIIHAVYTTILPANLEDGSTVNCDYTVTYTIHDMSAEEINRVVDEYIQKSRIQ